MQWSKLKTRVEACFAPSVLGRVQLRATRYRAAYKGLGRGSITVDGIEVWNMCAFQYMHAETTATHNMEGIEGVPAFKVQTSVREVLASEGVLGEWHFFDALIAYCDMSVTEILNSGNPLTRSLAMLDSRIGKRRLLAFDPAAEHQMVQYFHALRCSAERWERTAEMVPNGTAD